MRPPRPSRRDEGDVRTVRVRGVLAILNLETLTVTTLAPTGPPFVTHYPTSLEALAAWRQLLDGQHYVRLARLDRRTAGDALAARRPSQDRLGVMTPDGRLLLAKGWR